MAFFLSARKKYFYFNMELPINNTKALDRKNECTGVRSTPITWLGQWKVHTIFALANLARMSDTPSTSSPSTISAPSYEANLALTL